jgi:O-antigen/teichoic acid export membrane protein
MLEPLWPAYGEALARGDLPWIRKGLRRSLLLASCLAAPSAALLALFSGMILTWWVGPAITPSLWLVLGLGVWAALGPPLNALETFLNGANLVRFRAASMTAQAVSGILSKVLLAGVMGVAGIAWGGVISVLLFGAIPYVVFVRRWFVRARHDRTGISHA